MPAESSGQIEDIQVLEPDAIIVEHDLQAGDVGAFCLGQFVDIAFIELERLFALDVERDLAVTVFKSSEAVHHPGPEQFARADRPGPTRKCLPGRLRQ